MAALLDRLHAVRNAAAFNRTLEAAGSMWWLEKSGTVWRGVEGAKVICRAYDFETARALVIDYVRSQIEDGSWHPVDAKRPGRPTKSATGTAKTRAVRLTDEDWSALKLVGLDRTREWLRREAAKIAAKA